jgi:hypothetical protein
LRKRNEQVEMMPNDEQVTTAETEEWRRVLRQTLKLLRPEDLKPSSPCPDSQSMVSYVIGTAPGDLQKEINVHIAFCDDCWDDYVALGGREKIVDIIHTATGEQRRPLPIALRDAKDKWDQLFARANDFVIQLGRTYRPGTLIGTIRILEAGPAFAVRGATPPSASSVVFEVPLGDNVYGIALNAQDAGLFFDVAGYKTTELIRLGIALRSTDGEELVKAETDLYGHADFVLPAEELARDRIVVMLIVGDEVWEAFSLELPKADAALTEN